MMLHVRFCFNMDDISIWVGSLVQNLNNVKKRQGGNPKPARLRVDM
jgi:hypothetical protein